MTGSAIAQSSASLDPHDPAVIADFRIACAEEIKQAQAASLPPHWFNNSWVSMFQDWRPPGVFFHEIREAKQPRLTPYFYLRACASLTYIVQKKGGVGSGTEALARWRELRARFEKSLTEGAKSATPDTAARPAAPAEVSRPMETIVVIPFQGASSTPRKPTE